METPIIVPKKNSGGSKKECMDIRLFKASKQDFHTWYDVFAKLNPPC